MLSNLRAAALADRLELDVMTVGVCLACLSFAAFPLEAGDERTASNGPQTATARALVWRLAVDLAEDVRARRVRHA